MTRLAPPRPTTPRARLRRFLKQTKRTTGTLAAELGCGRSHVSLILTGRRRPGLRVALGIEEVTSSWSRGPIRALEWLEAEIARHGVAA